MGKVKIGSGLEMRVVCANNGGERFNPQEEETVEQRR